MAEMKPQMHRMQPQISQISSQISQISSATDRSVETHTRDPRTHAIIGAAMEVHRLLGCGFLEAVYQEALGIELGMRGIPNQREVPLPLYFKGTRLETHYRPDFVCYDGVVVELKAIPRLGPIEEAQIINYLKASQHTVGLLLNFGGASLEFKRYVNTTPPERTAMSNAAEGAGSGEGSNASAESASVSSAKSAVIRQDPREERC